MLGDSDISNKRANTGKTSRTSKAEEDAWDKMRDTEKDRESMACVKPRGKAEQISARAAGQPYAEKWPFCRLFEPIQLGCMASDKDNWDTLPRGLKATKL